MIDPIVSSSTPVCCVGGAPIPKSEILALSGLVTAYVAVDSGADHLRKAGVVPERVIGDLDSLSSQSRALFGDVLTHVTEQSTTDFEKALVRIDAPLVVALGFTGGRIDHSLSVLSVMLQHPKRPVVLTDAQDASFLALAGQTQFELPENTRVSVMPLVETTVSLNGVVWPFADQPMSAAGFTSPSNAALGGQVSITANAPVLVTLPRAYLPVAMQAAVRAK